MELLVEGKEIKGRYLRGVFWHLIQNHDIYISKPKKNPQKSVQSPLSLNCSNKGKG